MNRLLDPPGIKVAVQRMVCTTCGAEANASCTCGVAYTPKSIRAAEAVKADPQKSDRAIADEIGVGRTTVQKARAQVAIEGPPDKRIGQDGKAYPATKPQTQTSTDEPPDLVAQANKHLAKIIPLLRQMTTPERLNFRRVALQHMADDNLNKDPDEIEF
jgi:DNA-binding transcriptional MocR family regulator